MSTIQSFSNLNIQACGETMTVTSNTVEVDVTELSVVKTAGCDWTVSGGTVTFCTAVTNPSDTEIGNVLFNEVLDPRLSYVDGTFTFNGVPAIPTISGSSVEFGFNIPANSTVTICFTVLVSEETVN